MATRVPISLSTAPLTTLELHARLYEDILSGDIPPGAKLPSERQLAERYGVSRPVVRESLRRLQERGLIVVQPGRGSYVREVRATRGNASLSVGVRARTLEVIANSGGA